MQRNPRRRITLTTFKALFDTDEKCRAYLESVVWCNAPHCPHCGSTKVYRITGKSARPGLRQCGEKECSRQFTVTVGTVFEDSHLPLTKWFLAIYLISETSKGMSANLLKDLVGCTYKTAWYLGHRIRRMMDAGNVLLTGIIELDETYLGGKPRRGDPPRKRGRGTTKHPVFVAVQRGGEVRAATVDDVKFATMKPHLDRWLHGDSGFRGSRNGRHRTVFHRIKHFRRLATRNEKHAANFLAMHKLAAAQLWLRHSESVS